MGWLVADKSAFRGKSSLIDSGSLAGAVVKHVMHIRVEAVGLVNVTAGEAAD
jgi:hypothetical protein